MWLKGRGEEGAENLRKKQHRTCVCVREKRNSAGFAVGLMVQANPPQEPLSCPGVLPGDARGREQALGSPSHSWGAGSWRCCTKDLPTLPRVPVSPAPYPVFCDTRGVW